MGNPNGFLNIKRRPAVYRPVCERLKDYQHVNQERNPDDTMEQASRCMDCSTPFCHWACPTGNYIPEWNDLVTHKHWQKAFDLLDGSNNLPEITGRICPALCEYSCVLSINDEAITVRENELAIIEYAFKHGLVKPRKPLFKTGKKIAIIGSGPAGLSCADQLCRAGHEVTVFERDGKPGGILRYGIPDFKLEKWVLDRRINILEQAGIRFECGINAGKDIKADSLLGDFDAICLAGGCRKPRDLEIEGRQLSGIHFAMDYLIQSNCRVAGMHSGEPIDASGKKVVIIGGGDTGADCVGVANRQGASCVVQIELLPRPPECRTAAMPWPKYPMLLKTSTSHQEGAERKWGILTKKFLGQEGRVKKLSCVQVEFAFKDGCQQMEEIPGSGFEVEADLVILSMGFVCPEKQGLIEDLGLELDKRGNVNTYADFMTSRKGVFCAGDMRRGQSLVVWAVSEGRKAARSIDKYLMGSSYLSE